MKNIGGAVYRILIVMACVGVVVGAMLWLSGTFRTGQIEPGKIVAATRPLPGKTAAVQKVTRPLIASVVGSVEAENRTSIAARLIANILDMPVNAGDPVTKNKPLVLLDDAGPKARVEQAREALRAAEVARDLAQAEVNRYKKLTTQSVSGLEMDQRTARLASAEADVARMRQGLKEAEVGLDDAVVRSPIDGIVIDRLAEPGEQASPGKPLLTVYDPKRLRLEANVRETLITRLSVGQKIPIHIDALDEDREGTVSQIVPAADPGSRSFLVKILITNPAKLYPGMYARMLLPVDKQERLEIPASAVSRIGQLTFVDVASDGRTERRAIRLGQEADGRAEVLAGLDENEQVVVEPAAK